MLPGAIYAVTTKFFLVALLIVGSPWRSVLPLGASPRDTGGCKPLYPLAPPRWRRSKEPIVLCLADFIDCATRGPRGDAWRSQRRRARTQSVGWCRSAQNANPSLRRIKRTL